MDHQITRDESAMFVPSQVHHFTADPKVAVRAAWQLAVDEGNVEMAALLKRLMDAGAKPPDEKDDTAALQSSTKGDGVEEATAATTAAAAAEAPAAAAPKDAATAAAAAAASSSSSCNAIRAQLTQLQAQLAAFRRLARGLAVPPTLMAAATTNASHHGSDDDDNQGETEASHPVGTSLARRRGRQRLVDSKAKARVTAIAALPPTLPDEVRRAAAIESKALKLLALQRKVRYEVAMEPRLTSACSAPGVGLCRLNPAVTHKLESAWFQPLTLRSDLLVSFLLFQMVSTCAATPGCSWTRARPAAPPTPRRTWRPSRAPTRSSCSRSSCRPTRRRRRSCGRGSTSSS
jgi:pyruvate/2-oxoglutarate dehydrogenase complex dihydrolipoamide acyltransferase (E2) component